MEEEFIKNGLKTRDKTVFDFVFKYYYSGLCSYAEKNVGSPKVAEDLVQDLFVVLWMKNSQINITTSIKNYLFTSIKNRSLDHIKKRKRFMHFFY